jgi:carbonic anhydrase
MKRPFPNLAVFSVLLLGLLAGSKTWADEPSNIGAEQALQRLKDGNQRFATDKATHERQQSEHRAEIAKGQKPFAIIVCCSDSRVSPEITFDQGLGDLFVVRTAGNVVDDVGLGSIEYAVEHLGPRLIVVVGHSECGAVSAALSGGEVHGHLHAVVAAIKPAVEKAKGEPGNPLENAVRANVRETVKRLEGAGPVLADRVKAGKLKVVGGCYDLKSGLVKPVE